MPTFATFPLELLYWQRSLFDEPNLTNTERLIGDAERPISPPKEACA